MSSFANDDNDNMIDPPSQEDVQQFCEAANRGDIETVRSYLDQYGKQIVDGRDGINARAITWAAFSGHTDIVQLLVERGANINAGGTDEKPALTWAITSGRAETVSYLLQKGASLDVKDNSGISPIEYAKRSGNDEMIALIDQRLLEMKEYERLNGQAAKDAARAEAERATREANMEQLKKRHPPKLKF